MKKTVVLTSLIFILSFTNCSKTETLVSDPICQDTQNLVLEEVDLCQPLLMSYHFGLENLNPSQKVKTLTDLGMDGLIVEIDANTLSSLDLYYSSEEVLAETFTIYDVFTTIDVDNYFKSKQQLVTIENIYRKIKCQKTRLQVLFKGAKGSSNLSSIISKIAAIATKYNKDLIIYPHNGYAIESAEEALFYINTIQTDNVFLAFHLSHELATGNANRMEDVITNVSPYMKSVSLNGATVSEALDPNLPLFYWALKPLSMGTYDYSTVYNSLYANEYKGPIAIHTWGLLENFGLIPNQYLPESKAILYGLGTAVCE